MIDRTAKYNHGNKEFKHSDNTVTTIYKFKAFNT